MEILKNEEDIRNHIGESIKNNNLELEVIFGYDDANNPINKTMFSKLLESFKDKFNLTYESINLDIRHKIQNKPSYTRCSILDLESIKKYCITNSLKNIDNIKFIRKSLFKNDIIPLSTIQNRDYNYRITLKSEDDLEYNAKQIEEFNKSLETSDKHYRYKKRYSFNTPDQLFRIDLSVVKTTYFNKKNKRYMWAKSFKLANILNNHEQYELEIEYIGSSETKENGVILINDYYNKILKDIKNPVLLSGSVSNPLSLVVDPVKPTDTEVSSDFMKQNLIDVPVSFKEKNFKTEIIGKNVRIKDTFFEGNELNNDLKELLDKNPTLYAIVTDYQDNLDDSGKHALLQVNEPNEERKSLIKRLDAMFPDHNKPGFDPKSLKVLNKKPYLTMMKKLDNLNKDSIKIYVPLLEIYGDTFDIDALILQYYGEDEKSGGGKSTDDKELIFSDEKLQILTDKCIEILNEHISYILEIIHNTKLILSISQKNTILKRFKQLTGRHEDNLQNYVPQPVTLNYDNLLLNNDINIIKGYAVTEKADGIRCLLFITEYTGYLITQKMDVISAGIKFPNVSGEWLLDGEFITKDKDNKDIKLYMIFDIYYNSNNTPQQAYMYPWLNKDKKQISRNNILNDFDKLIQENILSDIEFIRLGIKEYKYGSLTLSDPIKYPEKYKTECKLIFDKCKEILHHEELGAYEYRIDGLILLPTYLGVKGNKLKKSMKHIGGSWEYNFKWKPEKENSIDFKIITEKDGKSKKDKVHILPDDDGKYKKVNIIVKYDERYDKNLDFCMKLINGDKFSYEKTKQFSPPDTSGEISSTNIALTDNKMICKDGSEIKDGDIVEMIYDKPGINGMIWIPLRVRHDKIVPNAIDTANNVWKTIVNPITNNLMTGDMEYDNELIIDDGESGDTGYYVSQNRSEQSNILTKFHNYIKTSLINGVCSSFNKRIQYLDLSCGRGGDVERYINPDNNIKFILGLDIEDVNEACRRFFIKPKRPKGIFLQSNTSLNIKNNECHMGDDHTKLMLNILYGDTTIKQYKDFNGLAKHGFDVVSSQFTLHYYLKDSDTFYGFLKNVYENINKGGYFIATFYNGNKLYDILEDKESLEYTVEDELIYKIQKKYISDNFEYDKDDTSNMFGNSISVYMDSIGKEFEEYLVNLDFLIDAFKEHGLELVTPKPDKKYENIFKKECLMTDGMGSFENVIKQIPNISKKDKIYQELYKEADNMTKDKHLQILSGLNVYVMFKKK